jgi:excinuclease ABC subunit C
VLQRDPEATALFRAQLFRLRTAAAESLRFELAARLQAEIEAVDWLLAPQQVTEPATGHHDVHGWAAGRLVGFEVRDGRVCGWTERDWSEAAAVPLLRRTAARWRPFADRAARLAGRLAAPGTTARATSRPV